VTVWFFTTGYKGAAEQELVVTWIAFYGLALLSTGLFRATFPRVPRLCFLVIGLGDTSDKKTWSGDLPANLPNVCHGRHVRSLSSHLRSLRVATGTRRRNRNNLPSNERCSTSRKLDKIIHEKWRLAIMALLASRRVLVVPGAQSRIKK